MAIESNSPLALPISVTSPKPVVESVATVESVKEILDLRIDPVLSDKDQRGDHEHEHGQVQRSKDDLLIAAHGRELPLELTEHVVGAEQPDRAQDAQEAEIAAECRDEQGGDHHEVDHRSSVVDVAHRV